METTLTREGDSTIRLVVKAQPDEVAPAIDRAVKHLGNEVKIPGFRKGHVPRKVLETRIGRDAIADETVREAVPMLLAQALTEHDNLQPLAPPVLEEQTYELDGDLTFEATIEVRPEITLPKFEMLSATRASSRPTDEEVDEQIARLQERYATLETVERPAQSGDHLLSDIHGTLHGNEIDVLSGSDQLYEIGSGWPVPEFDAELEGKRAGDIVQFNATLPDGMGEYAGTEVTFRILVKEVRQKITPALDDEFAKTASEYDTLAELRADVADRIEKVKKVQAESELRNTVLEQVLDDVEFEPPRSLVGQEMAYRLQRFEEQLKMGGMTVDAYLQGQDLTEEQLEADLRRQAERNVRAQLILEEIGRQEGFTVSEDELREEVRFHAETLRADASQLAQQLSQQGRLGALAGDIIRRKALNLLVERADITEEAPEVAESAGESPTTPEHDEGAPDA